MSLIPYYMDDLVTLYMGDCLTILPQLEEHFDLICTDPPYNLGKNFGNSSDKQEWEQYVRWSKEWLREVMSKLSDRGSLYFTAGPHSRLIQLFCSCLEQENVRLIPWCKNTGMLHRYAKSWEWFWEMVFCVRKTDEYIYLKPDGVEARDWWIFSTPWIEHKNRWIKHPTRKPEKLIEKIIKTSSFIDSVVFDPFCGSGTTLKVAKVLGRKAVGIEIEREYCDLVVERIRKIGV